MQPLRQPRQESQASTSNGQVCELAKASHLQQRLVILVIRRHQKKFIGRSVAETPTLDIWARQARGVAAILALLRRRVLRRKRFG